MVALERALRRPAPPPIGADGIRAAARGRGVSARQMLFACVLGSLVLSLFAARDLPSWAGRLSDGPLTPVLRQAAYRWDRTVSGLGLELPQRALRRAVMRFKHYRWP